MEIISKRPSLQNKERAIAHKVLLTEKDLLLLERAILKLEKTEHSQALFTSVRIMLADY